MTNLYLQSHKHKNHFLLNYINTKKALYTHILINFVKMVIFSLIAAIKTKILCVDRQNPSLLEFRFGSRGSRDVLCVFGQMAHGVPTIYDVLSIRAKTHDTKRRLCTDRNRKRSRSRRLWSVVFGKQERKRLQWPALVMLCRSANETVKIGRPLRTLLKTRLHYFLLCIRKLMKKVECVLVGQSV